MSEPGPNRDTGPSVFGDSGSADRRLLDDSGVSAESHDSVELEPALLAAASVVAELMPIAKRSTLLGGILRAIAAQLPLQQYLVGSHQCDATNQRGRDKHAVDRITVCRR